MSVKNIGGKYRFHLLCSIVLVTVMTLGGALVEINAQGSVATLSGTVTDEAGAVIPGAEVTIENPETGFKRTVITNNSGNYVFPALKPDTYNIRIQKEGFTPVEFQNVVLNVGDEKGLTIQMKVGAVDAEVTVNANAALVDISGAVSTVVNESIKENVPLNGRDIRPLLQLSPGVVSLPTTDTSGGFSVNGQRTTSNYVIVDGVSANTGIASRDNVGPNTVNGSFAGTNVQGSFTNQASLDSIQEFQLLTSTFAPEFGRTPGGQVIITTKSGTNDFHGSLYEDFRNDALDANDFFSNSLGLPKPALRYNLFGGTLGGPLPFLNFGEGVPVFTNGKDRTHFFVSYEGQRFRQPKPAVMQFVPSLEARQNAANPGAAAILNAFPQPTGPTLTMFPDVAPYNVGFSDPNAADNFSVRIDHSYKSKYVFFGRFGWSTSSLETRSLSYLQAEEKNGKFITFGATQAFVSNFVNDFRFNWTASEANKNFTYDGFGGGGGFPSNVLGAGKTSVATYLVFLSNGHQPRLWSGPGTNNLQRQINFVDNITYNAGAHQLKFGGDFRRLSPTTGSKSATYDIFFTSLDEVNALTPLASLLSFQQPVKIFFDTFSIYGQDTWQVNPKTTVTFGLRWDFNPSPKLTGDDVFATFDRIPDLSQTDQSSVGIAFLRKYYDTDLKNFAPRIGIAYRANEKPGKELIVRGGFGIFYDIGQTGFSTSPFPYGGFGFQLFPTLPFPPFSFPAPNFDPRSSLFSLVQGVDESYDTPRTYQWNIAAEQSLGNNQAVSIAYVGSLGRNLIRTRIVDPSPFPSPPRLFHPLISAFLIVGSEGEANYHSLQTQFQRRLSKRFSAIVNYTISKSEDNESTNFHSFSPTAETANLSIGPSDFDVRHNLTGAVTYEIPTPKLNGFAEAVLGGWTLNSYFVARSALPFNVKLELFDPLGGNTSIFRPDLTGDPLWIFDDSLPGGRRVNPSAFDLIRVPAGNTHGTHKRNSLRGLGAWQIDMGLQKEFELTESMNLQLRIESFNILNHTNFASPSDITVSSGIPSPTFGRFNRILSRATGSSIGGNPLFNLGGPRSHQLSVRLKF